MSEECDICANTKTKFVVCYHCEFTSCLDCNKRYILESVEDPSCMSCKKQWSRKFLNKNFGKVFCRNDLKIHRENILFDRQKAMLPATQAEATERINKEKLELEKIKVGSKFDIQINELTSQIRKIESEIYKIKMDKSRAIAQLMGIVIEKKEPIHKTIIGKCSECRGFIMNDHKCSMCETSFCSKCMIKKETQHKCLESDIETVKLMKQDTKPCPGCGANIFRVEGCYQMWCTLCHTTFCWRTGAILKEAVHNPHYFEYLRAHPELDTRRNEAREECRDVQADIYNTIYLVRQFNYENYRKLNSIYENINNYNRVFQKKNVDDEFKEIRIKYLMNKIDENGFKKLCQQAEKKISLYNEIFDIKTSYYTLFCSTVIHYHERCFEPIKNLTKEFNEHIKDTLEIYGSTAWKTNKLEEL